jgi:hypothetical protein
MPRNRRRGGHAAWGRPHQPRVGLTIEIGVIVSIGARVYAF